MSTVDGTVPTAAEVDALKVDLAGAKSWHLAAKAKWIRAGYREDECRDALQDAIFEAREARYVADDAWDDLDAASEAIKEATT
jgi:hypothetical protein